ncbi:MAG: hypothetical protein F4163_13205 [Acidimicrobiaceae bacterium]|nr:hypothetical protein [Acidimicrobiaceae bacterium]
MRREPRLLVDVHRFEDVVGQLAIQLLVIDSYGNDLFWSETAKLVHQGNIKLTIDEQQRPRNPLRLER